MRWGFWSSAVCAALWSVPATAEVKSTTCYCGIQLHGSVSDAACIRACGGREQGPRDGDEVPWHPEKPPPPPPPAPPTEAPSGLPDEPQRLAAAAAVGVRSALQDARAVRLARAARVLRAAGATTAGRAAIFAAPRLLGVAGSVLLAYDAYRVARNLYARRERKKRRADPGQSRYGLCSKKEHRGLQDRVDHGECSKARNCLDLINAMKGTTTTVSRPEELWREICAGLHRSIDMYRQCIQDRDAVMRICYREQPKDSERWKTHQDQLDFNRAGIEFCQKSLANFGCP